ncbi:Rieske Fe-S protein [Arthrobacter silviterrae]|uniref:Cytochrome bc1 complex Rieske iron-sulfur subunit n=1 Tax=Arthrobacter silviterrae TaxID=2026658 RepID=A0ABX0DCH6_9MICC|nr:MULTISPECIES: Rieske (2Fe-2S) protein [Arthrobacter]MCU6481594.1 Rieske (2Fe-2S) protein [Arthrobacter sp. A2-55]MDQ0275868.1 Rieske Fe-S protein [Arthrobacter silviterrae]NGN84627.1 Rieske (2Fe-2S) protein [Arthrobacter silviterrae]
MTSPPPSRRAVLRSSTVAAGGACALALAGCVPAVSAGPSQGSTPGTIPTTGTPVRVGKLSDVPVGSTAQGKANNVNIVIFRAAQDKVYAYSDVCTHAGCEVAPSGADFKCPCHGSVFKGADGTVITGPAKQALPRYAAAIDGEWITVSV